jgi:serine protease inhibitor
VQQPTASHSAALPEPIAPTPAASAPARTPAKPQLSAAQHARAAAHLNTFGLACFKRLASVQTNVAFSPASLGIALHMLEEGARGASRTALEKVLAAPAAENEVLADLARAWAQLATRDQLQLAVANGLFARSGA